MSASAAAAPPADAAPAPAKKGGAMKLIVAVLVAALAAGGGAFFFMSKKAAAEKAAAASKAAVEGEEGEGDATAEEAEAEEEEEPAADEKKPKKDGSAGAAASDFAALSPQFVVNLNDPEAMRFLQVEVQVIAKKAAAMEAVKTNDPVVRNRLMLLFSSQTYHELLTREGKEKLQAAATDEINKVLKEHKKPAINGVVFTNFVMQ